MSAMVKLHRRAGVLTAAVVVAVAPIALAACGSSGGTPSSAAGANPGTMFKAANVSGLGTVLVDARGRTVYVLTSGNHTNVPCDDSSGCTKVWPDLPLPDGTAAATAGPGVQASLLGTMKSSDGETYPTYGQWLMYEYTGDSSSGQAHGQGIQSFGGTWYALSPSGEPVTAAAPTPKSAGGGYGG
jgi:predicted lipoprotein with Yx(FWY)xxD motif